MSGTVDGSPFTADVQVTGTRGDDSGWYNGTFTGTGSSAGIGGSFSFSVECASGLLIEQKGWYVESSDPDYWRGEVTGSVENSGGSGTWECTSECTGSGSFTLTPR